VNHSAHDMDIFKASTLTLSMMLLLFSLAITWGTLQGSRDKNKQEEEEDLMVARFTCGECPQIDQLCEKQEGTSN
jgi:hypothetical protein